jgi:MoaA/NifB/PqqE/SkfB family radical SAM enzyme
MLEYPIISRAEAWGEVIYDPVADEFRASINAGSDPVPATPIGVGWIIIGACNLQCIHCYGNVEELPRKVLSTSECIQVVNRLSEAKVMRVIISGGEPLLRDDLDQIVGEMVTKNIAVILGTNGSFLERAHLPMLHKCTRVEISLDAANRTDNNRIRPSRLKVGSAWRETVDAIGLLTANGVKLRVLTAINRINQGQLDPQ